MVGSPLAQVRTQTNSVFVRLRMTSQSRSDGFGHIAVPDACRRCGAGAPKLDADVAQFLKFGRLQTRDLLLESANARDLTDAGWNAERQEVTRHIERTRVQIAAICVL